MLTAYAYQQVRSLTELPPFPATHIRLQPMAKASDWIAHLGVILQTIEFDAALTASLLRLANATGHSIPVVFSSLRQWVMHAGMGEVMRQVWPMLSQVKTSSLPVLQAMERRLWRRSAVAGLAVLNISAGRSKRFDPLMFTAALLQDIGQVVILRSFGPGIVDKIEAWKRKGASQLEAEQQVLTLDHAELGGALARAWRFPEALAQAIETHHVPAAAGTLESMAWMAGEAADHYGSDFAGGYRGPALDLFPEMGHPAFWEALQQSMAAVESGKLLSLDK